MNETTTITNLEIAKAAGYEVTSTGRAYRLVHPAGLSQFARMVRLYPGDDVCKAFLASHGIMLTDVR